ncbi:peptidase M20A family protein [Gemmatimonas aurantiaca T-27]|uniref:Peptidase M20A family protein n=1 Tax=Gemmatimonas aurantiaca (strain DSM 14586 / JCM 11422 / NBRC 100505 / T-27) TaxID=379066 RepID=C1A413_GEMAT|nr:M20/M25/M40 family metallo-hydrolase [Gemmatimonas aurantiaca]BAH38838.1 peptidase M20A family protein [Gemmatimonas aurantiaca T-27]
MSDVVALASEMLSIDSTTGRERDVVEFTANWLIEHGWNVTLQEVEPGRSNVWASRRGGGVTLSTHLDTVPPFVPPRLDGSRLYGRGSSDAKGIAAAMMIAAQRLADAGEERVDLLFVVGEEKGSPGARAANRLEPTSKWLVNGEPTESKLASGCKGAQRVIVRVRGREAHSAYAHLGSSALEPLLELLPRLRDLPLPVDPILGPTTYNIGVLRAGTEANIVPGHAEAEIMIRLVGDIEPVKRLFAEWAGDRVELVWGSHIPAQHFQVINGFEVEPVAYTSDIPLLDRWGTPLLFGPGSIHVAHTPIEYIDVAELDASVDAYVRIVRTLLA